MTGLWLLILGGDILVFEDSLNEFVVLYALFIIAAGFVLAVASIISKNISRSFMWVDWRLFPERHNWKDDH